MFGCYGGREKRAAAGGRDYKHGLMGNGKLGGKWKWDVLAGGKGRPPAACACLEGGLDKKVSNTHRKVASFLKGGGRHLYTLKFKK